MTDSVRTNPLPRGLGRLLILSLGLTLLAIRPVAGQQDAEPILDDVREMFSSPGLTLSFLARIVLDPGIDGAEANASVNQARLRLQGELDGGFNYLIQTNHTATPALLDARVGWTRGPEFHVWAGRFKTPYSQELLDYAGTLDFVSRSRVVSALAPNRQVGVQLGGQLTEIVSWEAGGFTGSRGSTPNEPLVGVVRVRGTGVEVGDGTLQVSGQVAVGRDAAVAQNVLGTGFDGDGVVFGLDGRYDSGPLMLTGEYHRGDFTPDVGPEVDADGLFLTAGWMVAEDRQLLARWDRFRSVVGEADDVLVLGFNAWPTSAAKMQVNWQLPLKDSGQIHRLLVALQMGI